MRYLPLAFIFMASAAHAQDMLLATAPEPIAAILQEAGLQAQIEKDQVGDPLIKSSVSGANFGLLFFGCTDGTNCSSVGFTACFKLDPATSMDVINKWNDEIRYSRALLGTDMTSCLRQDIDMTGGISADSFKSALQTWSQNLGKFTVTIGY